MTSIFSLKSIGIVTGIMKIQRGMRDESRGAIRPGMEAEGRPLDHSGTVVSTRGTEAIPRQCLMAL